MSSEEPAQVSRIRLLSVRDLADAQREVYERITRGRRAMGPQHSRLVRDGHLTGPFNVMLHAPSIGRRLSDLGEALRYEGLLSDRAREIVILTVAASKAADYEWYVHEPIGRTVGLTDTELHGLRHASTASEHEPGAADPGRGGPVPFTDPVEVSAHEVALAVAWARPVGEEAFRRWEATLGEALLVEAVILAGYYVLLASVLSVFAIGVPEGERPFADPGGQR